VVPKFGFRSARGILTGLFLLSMVAMAILIPAIFFFPALLGYVGYGVAKSVVLGFFERLPDRDPLLDEEEGDEAGAELREIDYGELSPRGRLADVVRRRGGRRRRQRGGSSNRQSGSNVNHKTERPDRARGST
jgi:hypothetical protein